MTTKKLTIHIGLNSNITYNGHPRHMLLIDLDENKPSEEDLIFIARRLCLSYIDIWVSSNIHNHPHYWLICMKPVTIDTYIKACQIVKADTKFINCLKLNGYGTLRITKKYNQKPYFIRRILFTTSTDKISNKINWYSQLEQSFNQFIETATNKPRGKTI